MKRTILTGLLFVGFSFWSNAQVLTKINDVAPLQEDLVGVKKGDAWGFINTDGKLVVDFREDIVYTLDQYPVFNDGLCLIQEVKDGITYYGYINAKGDEVIPAEYLDATPFEKGYARVIKHYKVETGTTNALGKRIVNYSYNELLIDTTNETVQHLRGPHHLLFDANALKTNPPLITSRFIGDDFIAVRENDNTYSIYKLEK